MLAVLALYVCMVRCCYNMVKFLQNVHYRYPITHPWGVYWEFNNGSMLVTAFLWVNGESCCTEDIWLYVYSVIYKFCSCRCADKRQCQITNKHNVHFAIDHYIFLTPFRMMLWLQKCYLNFHFMLSHMLSTLIQVTACGLTTPNYYVNQCWHVVN